MVADYLTANAQIELVPYPIPGMALMLSRHRECPSFLLSFFHGTASGLSLDVIGQIGSKRF